MNIHTVVYTWSVHFWWIKRNSNPFDFISFHWILIAGTIVCIQSEYDWKSTTHHLTGQFLFILQRKRIEHVVTLLIFHHHLRFQIVSMRAWWIHMVRVLWVRACECVYTRAKENSFITNKCVNISQYTQILTLQKLCPKWKLVWHYWLITENKVSLYSIEYARCKSKCYVGWFGQFFPKKKLPKHTHTRIRDRTHERVARIICHDEHTFVFIKTSIEHATLVFKVLIVLMTITTWITILACYCWRFLLVAILLLVLLSSPYRWINGHPLRL